MNKAFVREPDPDGRELCPACGSLAVEVGTGPLDLYIAATARGKLGETACFCPYDVCDVAYFDQLGGLVHVDELTAPVYPKDPGANLWACFGFTMDDVRADADASSPMRIRELLERSQSAAARCASLAPDGRCCMTEIRRLYLKFRQQ